MPHPEPDSLAKAHAAPQRRDAPLRGIGLILLGSVFFTAGDVASKILTESVPPLQIIWIRYIIFALIMLGLVWRGGGLARLTTQRPMLQFLRGVGVTLSSIFFVIGLRYLPIADATASSFVAPLFVTALSIVILGEVIGWRRWTATIIGLVGVLIVVRPGGANFGWASLLPIVSALAWAFALIMTRLMSRTEGPLATLTYSALTGCVMLSLCMPFVWQPLSREALMIGVFIGVSSTVGHWILVAAYRYADASLLAPFSYVQLLWATLFGFLLFSTLPDLWTLVGAVIIAASGLYTAHRERIRARQALDAQAR